MTGSLKPGTTKQKKVKYHTNLLILAILALFVGIPSLACTRSVSEPVQLTEAAIRFEITKIGLQTSVPDEVRIQAVNNGNKEQPLLPTEPIPTAIRIIPISPVATETAPANPPTKAPVIQVINTSTPRSDEILSPTPRNTFPVESIDSENPPTSEPSGIAFQPVETEVFAPIATEPEAEISEPQSLPDLITLPTERLLYVSQNGDTLTGIANRFGVSPDQISSIQPISSNGFLDPNITLFIASSVNRTYESAVKILPDEYVVYSGTATNFDLRDEITQANGYLSTYEEELTDGKASGADIVYKVSQDYAINPIVLLALLEYKSNWVYGYPKSLAEKDYPLGWFESTNKGLYKQLTWAATTLSQGYYDWRYGSISEIPYYKYPKPPQAIYFDPTQNAGSVSIQYLFAQLYTWDTIGAAIYGDNGFYATFTSMFGNIWENYIPPADGLNADLRQPTLTMPFTNKEKWAMTGGPHAAWTTGSPFGALDFAPPSQYHGCADSDRWVLSSSDGVVVRTGKGIVVVDLDGDGLEETGWVLLYLHVATKDKISPGTLVSVGTKIGHPSCEGGAATGTHVHVARKYNGEWIKATGPLPFVLSGWVPYEGEKEYLGGMTRGEDLIQASQVSSGESIVRY